MKLLTRVHVYCALLNPNINIRFHLYSLRYTVTHFLKSKVGRDIRKQHPLLVSAFPDTPQFHRHQICE